MDNIIDTIIMALASVGVGYIFAVLVCNHITSGLLS